MENLVLSQVTGSTAVVLFIQWLKDSKMVPFINGDTAALNRMVAVVMAMLTASGMHFAFDSSDGVLTITGLHAANVVHFLWESMKAFSTQYLIYKGVLGKAA